MELAATISDIAGIRAHECLLPDFVRVANLALRLAELTHQPKRDTNGRKILYGLFCTGQGLLNQDAKLEELTLPNPLLLRLVPEICAAAEEAPPEPVQEPCSKAEEGLQDWDIVIGEPMALVHDDHLHGKLDVRIDAETHQQITQFAQLHQNKECAGLLLGRIESENNTRIIHVTAVIPANRAAGDHASVRVSLAAWETMLLIKDADYPEHRILGWFHSHSAFGVFMSEADLFLHRHFFPHPNMIAYVIDPATGRDGFFYWKDGEIAVCPSYGVVGSASQLKPYGLKQRDHKPPVKRNSFNIYKWIAVAVVVVALYLLISGSLFSKPTKLPVVPEPVAAPPVVTPIQPVQQPAAAKAASASKEIIYIIKKRDNPWIICNRIYGDGDLGPALMRYNGLKDVTGLQVGQRLKLPSKETLRKLRKP